MPCKENTHNSCGSNSGKKTVHATNIFLCSSASYDTDVFCVQSDSFAIQFRRLCFYCVWNCYEYLGLTPNSKKNKQRFHRLEHQQPLVSGRTLSHKPKPYVCWNGINPVGSSHMRGLVSCVRMPDNICDSDANQIPAC